ncbi:MAG: sigma-54 dependent transcriptional regulator [Acidobacteriota bacterium]
MSLVLLVEDDTDLAFAVERLLVKAGHRLQWAADGTEALAMASSSLVDLVLLDLGLPDLDGFEVLERLLALDSTLQVVVFTGRDDAETAVRALRLGAADYLTKPVSAEMLRHAVARADERGSLRRRVETLDRGSGEGERALGDAPAFVQALDALRAAARAPKTPVLLTGESGTGKELAARLLHSWGERADGPMISVNAGAFPGSLLESELYGHEAGAFTGARGVRRGLFELATGGSLFLDEIGELSAELQPKLLRVLEGHPFRRLGGEREVRCDFRLISATHRDLAVEVERGSFRQDLYHRLRILEIRLPPLRERLEDIPLLAVAFATRLGRELGRGEVRIGDEAMACLKAYPWPGNVRELRNVIERAIVLSPDGELVAGNLPLEVASALTTPAQQPTLPNLPPGVERLDEVVRAHVRAVFEQAGGNLTHAAERLGITRGTLRRHLKSTDS